MKTINSLLAGASMLALAGGASAQPLALSDEQMDGITAGAAVLPIAVAVAVASGGAYGTVLSGTSAIALTSTSTLAYVYAFGASANASIGVSAYTPGCGTCGATAASFSAAGAAVQ